MEFNELQKIKRQFFALRNGITADALRKGGSPFSIIFGLTLPQITEIARQTGYNQDLAMKLWRNRSTRCSMLLAPMLMDPQNLEPNDALKLIDEIPCNEVADVICLKLFSRTDFVAELIDRLVEKDGMYLYVALRLMQRYLRGKDNPPENWIKVLKVNPVGNADINLRFMSQSILSEIEGIDE